MTTRVHRNRDSPGRQIRALGFVTERGVCTIYSDESESEKEWIRSTVFSEVAERV